MEEQQTTNNGEEKGAGNGANPNQEGTNPNTAGNTASSTPSSSQPPAKEIKVKVDLKQKPIQEDEKVTVQSDDDFFKDVTQPTEKDITNDKTEQEKLKALKDKLSGNTSSSSQPSSSVSTPSNTPYDKRKAQAEKWTNAICIVSRIGCKWISGQVDNVGLDPLKDEKDALTEALADVFVEYDWNPAPVLTLLVTAGAVLGTPWMNAFESRAKVKELQAGKKKEEMTGRIPNIKPEFDPRTGEHRKKRGGQFKA